MMGRLGADPSAPYVATRRTNQEKIPWKNLPRIENRVEAEFLRPVVLGESILPYRNFQPFEAVVPVTDKGEVLDAEAAANRGFDGLHGWMSAAERVWNANAESGPMTLIGRWNYHNELGAQFPLVSRRVVYAASGTNPAACILKEPAVIEHSLYWSKPDTKKEARYSPLFSTAKQRVSAANPFNLAGNGAREISTRSCSTCRFHASTPTIPCTRTSPKPRARRKLSPPPWPLPENTKFQRARGLVRAALTDAGVAQRIDALVARLLDGG